MKKWMRIGAIGAVLLFGLQSALPVSAETETEESGIEIDTSGDETYDVFTYREADDGGWMITSCDTAATSAEIPSEIDGTPVTAIGDAAFMSCNFLTKIDIPEGITEIGESAFSSCSILYQVTLPESLCKIGAGAFESCTTLITINLPSTLTELSDALFYNCSALGEIELPDTVRAIGNETFYSCTRLTNLELPENVERIGDYAFQNCQALTTVTIPASCTELGDYVFDGCQALTEIVAAPENPSYMTQDGVLFTADGQTLIRYPQARAETSYTVPENCSRLEDWSFIGSTTLEQLQLGQVSEIGEDCFYYCTSLQEIIVPDGVAELKGAVFAYCVALKKITLPSTMQTLGDNCFYACTALESITVPEGVTTIGDQCFYNCGSLVELTLPSTITKIGENALGYYDSSETSQMERMDQLVIHNEGSEAVDQYLHDWKNGSSTVLYWIIAGIVVAVVAAVIVILVLVHRKRNQIRPTSRHAPERGKSSSGKKRNKKK